MRSNPKPLFLSALLATLILGVLTWSALYPLDWTTVASKRSPDDGWTAYHVRSRSEAGAAPYGDHLVLAPAYWPFGRYYGELVFAGYCSDELVFHWVGAHQLRLECTAEKVIKMVDAYKEIRIQHANVSTGSEARTPPPSH